MALENGMLVLNSEISEQGPSIQEQFVLFRVAETKYALKTYTGKK